MTREEYRTTAMDVVYLAACAVYGTVPDGERVQAMNLNLLYQVASRHLLTAITAMALELLARFAIVSGVCFCRWIQFSRHFRSFIGTEYFWRCCLFTGWDVDFYTAHPH